MIKAVRRAKLFVFLREHRHELFDEQMSYLACKLWGSDLLRSGGLPGVETRGERGSRRF